MKRLLMMMLVCCTFAAVLAPAAFADGPAAADPAAAPAAPAATPEPEVITDPASAFEDPQPSTAAPDNDATIPSDNGTGVDPGDIPSDSCEGLRMRTHARTSSKGSANDHCNLDPYTLPVPAYHPAAVPAPVPTTTPTYRPPSGQLPYTGWNDAPEATMLATIFLLLGSIAYMIAARMGLVSGFYENAHACRMLATRLGRNDSLRK